MHVCMCVWCVCVMCVCVHCRKEEIIILTYTSGPGGGREERSICELYYCSMKRF